jgi:hypothetical protein
VTSYPPVPKTSWFLNALIMLVVTLIIQRAFQPLIDWFALQGRFSYFGLILIPLAAAFGAMGACQIFMRKFGPSLAIQKRLMITYGAALLLWVLVVVGLGLALRDPRGLGLLSGFTVAQLAVQIAMACAGTAFVGYRFRSSQMRGALSK